MRYQDLVTRASRTAALTLAAIAIAACSSTGVVPAPTQAPIAIAPPPATVAPTAVAPTQAPAAPTDIPPVPLPEPMQPAPTQAPATAPTQAPPPQPAGQLTTYRDAAGRWSLSYPADVLQPLDMGDGVIMFIAANRSTLVAIDSFDAGGDLVGVDGAGIRSRAGDVLANIYGLRPRIGPLAQYDAPWEAGFTFRTDAGSEGIAVYQQPLRSQGDYRVYGLIYAYKAAHADAALRIIQPVVGSLQLDMTAAPAPEQPVAELDMAQMYLENFFLALHDRRYGDAAGMYGGPYDLLQSWNPDIAPGDGAALLQSGCEANGLHCLVVRRVLAREILGGGRFSFAVEFGNPNGTLFHDGTGRNLFSYSVAKQGDRYLVQELPIYTQ